MNSPALSCMLEQLEAVAMAVSVVLQFGPTADADRLIAVISLLENLDCLCHKASELALSELDKTAKTTVS